MTIPHKWASEIKAWADGAEIEELYQEPAELWGEHTTEPTWSTTLSPLWGSPHRKFRVKQPEKPLGQVLFEAMAPTANWALLTSRTKERFIFAASCVVETALKRSVK